MDRKSARELQEHMLGTYDTLRIMLTVIGIALPIVVVAAASFQEGRLWIESSISQYYHLAARHPFFTARDLFVGGMLAAAVCLYSYKGFSTRENVALNCAGVFAFFVAVLPIAIDEQDRGLRSVLHATAAVLFFLSIAYVSLRRSRDTLRLLPESKRARYARLYFLTGLAMIASPAGAVVLSYALDAGSPTSRWIFFVETLGIWAFAAYWWFKTLEMRETKVDRRALDAELERELVAPLPSADAGSTAANTVDKVLRRAMVPNTPTVERIVPANPPAAADSADAASREAR